MTPDRYDVSQIDIYRLECLQQNADSVIYLFFFPLLCWPSTSRATLCSPSCRQNGLGVIRNPLRRLRCRSNANKAPNHFPDNGTVGIFQDAEIYSGAWQQVRVVAAARFAQVDAAGLRSARSLRPVYVVTHTLTPKRMQHTNQPFTHT